MQPMEGATERRKPSLDSGLASRRKRKARDRSSSQGAKKVARESHHNSPPVQDTACTSEPLAPATGPLNTLSENWEVDSGFSETSPPASGRNSPSLSSTMMVAMDCEMVGTGPGGRCSELARCSILDYHGNVLYDKYVQPCQPVTNYRTPWSGIRSHHLRKATPFAEARDQVRMTPSFLQASSSSSSFDGCLDPSSRRVCSPLWQDNRNLFSPNN